MVKNYKNFLRPLLRTFALPSIFDGTLAKLFKKSKNLQVSIDGLRISCVLRTLPQKRWCRRYSRKSATFIATFIATLASLRLPKTVNNYFRLMQYIKINAIHSSWFLIALDTVRLRLDQSYYVFLNYALIASWLNDWGQCYGWIPFDSSRFYAILSYNVNFTL